MVCWQTAWCWTSIAVGEASRYRTLLSTLFLIFFKLSFPAISSIEAISCMMKESVFLLVIIFLFFSLENVSPFPLLRSSSGHREQFSPEHVQPFQHSKQSMSPCPLGAMTTRSSTNDKINCKNSSSTQQKHQQRFRRSFAYESQCLPVKKIRCRAFVYAGKTINFCAEYDHIVCTALDWMINF